jgi:hypothetical protein
MGNLRGLSFLPTWERIGDLRCSKLERPDDLLLAFLPLEDFLLREALMLDHLTRLYGQGLSDGRNILRLLKGLY